MYEILIVDDSVLDIDCITFLIKKYNLPLHTTTAKNGRDALALFSKPKAHYDILFTDIKMPFMDGIELSREVRNLSPETKIIIFSGFNDFEYAKTAITIGVQDYLTKPIVPNDFASTIQKVIRSIEEEHIKAKSQHEQYHIVKNHLLWRIINNSSVPDEFTDLLDSYHSLMMIECENEFFNTEGLLFEQKLTELLPLSFDYLSLYPTRSLLFIHDFRKEVHLLSIAQTICLFAEEEYHQKCYISFDILTSNAEISNTYLHLEKRMDTRFFFPERYVIPPNSPGDNYSPAGHISVDILTDDLKLADYNSFLTHLDEIFDSLLNGSTNSLIYVKYCFTELAKVLLQASTPPRSDINILAEKIYNSTNISQLIEMMRTLAENLVKPEQDSQNRPKTDKIKQYIYQNHAQPLTLNDIAAHFYISPNYLCSIFKKETGCNLTKFINNYRLKRASELLLTTEMKINTIAEAVGFHNTSYFCQRFRDSYGVTPEIYRQKEGKL